ncbi:MAG: DnaJ domain-containing protein, partial [Phycisphaeraceae bacterium]|nr:DnaJ domain-containing protein [Phycisphaeraceae bacterium]
HRAYRKLARKYHPDVNKSADAAERFSEVNEAHEVLKDPEKRKRYDLLGENWKNGQEFTPPPGGEGMHFRFGSGGGGGDFSPGGFSEFFEMFFGSKGAGASGASRGGGMGGGNGAAEEIFRRMTAGRAGFGAQDPAGSARQAEVEAELSIGLQEAANGSTRSVDMRLPDGHRKTIEVKIPAGSTDGDRLRLRGEGVTIRLKVTPDPRFRVEGRNLITRLDIAPWEAVNGTRANVPSLEGELTVTVPPGSQSGSKLRLSGKGIPPRAGKQPKPGDLLVELRIVVPRQPTEEQKKAFERLRDECGFDPRA